MKLFELAKDGGPESHVWGYFLIEIKSLFSIVLLRFENGSRDAFHSHAFNSTSWVLKGKLVEEVLDEGSESGVTFNVYEPSLTPVMTYRDTNHKVVSLGRTWVLSFRGPWADSWKETLPGGESVTLTNGRRIV